MDSVQATRALRARPALQALPILAMTANAFDEDRDACLAAGMIDFVAKPVQPLSLYAMLRKWLDRGSPSQPPAPRLPLRTPRRTPASPEETRRGLTPRRQALRATPASR